MREPKSTKRIETLEEIRRREKRFQRREKTIARVSRKRQYRLERKEKKDAENSAAEQILAEDRKRNISSDKKSDACKLLEAFSYISWTPYDKRDTLPQGFRSHSFNKDRQYIDFFKTYIYPYPIPIPLLFTTLQKDHFLDEQGKEKKSAYYGIINLSKQWVSDIASGDSFHRKNKEYFTKADAHYFLTETLPYSGPLSVVRLYFYAKCKAKNMSVKQCMIIAKVFTLKFEKYFNHAIVAGFLDLLARSPDYQVEEGELGDICDFVLVKINKKIKWGEKFQPFSFSGRTMTSIIGIANEWHAEIQREQEALDMIARTRNPRQQHRPATSALKERWRGFNIANFAFETVECKWRVTQLLTAQDLLNEGRKMKNCVSSYAYKCSSGECSIFNLSSYDKDSHLIESHATLEVTKDRLLIQAKAKFNIRVSPKAMNVINRWAQANRIKNGVL
ncbi:PcfJ domain-containing protein [Treponema primitia]|uniref:PcfJ domain-containing protein n=1 Tax=Treponema primitia TaxID=88058 RepID=UPI0002554DA1|nr:PcfJ domain-containing protein [Treponema primitia]